ncbi:putative pectinesterase/pectinesterase inhibitor 54 [Abeliophyllum distichum]|uniref:Pectinesterase n=1 Tax=Abeliophyllum distichum TaxID=126358 RepID=A0ABD1V7K7_9LAMI
MGAPKCVVLVLLVLTGFNTVSWAAYEEDVRTKCAFTRYPRLCVETLTGLGSSGNQHVDFMYALVNKTISETKVPISKFQQLNFHFVSEDAQLARIIDYCHELLSMSMKWLNCALEELKESPRKSKEDIQTWLSAVITFQQACKDTVTAQAPSNVFLAEISKKMDYLSELASNPLALVNQISKSRNKIFNDRHLLEEVIFPGWVSASDRKLLESKQIKPNVIVAKDGSGNYKTISDAIQAATGSRFIIYVKSGVYNEKINTNKDGITLIGDGKYLTIITASSSVAGGSILPDTATFTITGNGFMARDIGFQNTAGPRGEQAVALTIASDHSVLHRCSILGYQDTLYALSHRQFYRECDIYGTIDFIFGNAAAVIQSCNLILRRPAVGAYNAILAHGRTDPGQNSGFSIQNCRITVSLDFSPIKHSYKSYLGRPWKQFSRAVVMESIIDDAIALQGWIERPGVSVSTYTTLYFAEYANTGPGAETSKRVKWSGFHVIEETEANKFTVANFIGGTSWLPFTGVTFISGLH